MGWQSIDPVTGHGHRFVERRYFERDVVGHYLEAHAAHGVLDEEVVRERAAGTAIADDPPGCRHRVDHDVVAYRDAGDVATDLDDLAGRLVAQRHAAVVVPHAAQRDVKRVRTADSAGPDFDQHIRRPDGRRRHVDDLCLVGRCHYRDLHHCVLKRKSVVARDQCGNVAGDDVGE